MVVFICNACGDSLKKQQVEKHLFQICRGNQTVSCVDCSHDFTATTYKQHIRCFTEEEKYSGKNHLPKVNKGQVKQEQWTQRVQAALTGVDSDPRLKAVLERMLDYDNIPRKKAKFENFMRNSFRSMVNPTLIEKIWNIVETNVKLPVVTPNESECSKSTDWDEESSPCKKAKTDLKCEPECAMNDTDECNQLRKFKLVTYILEKLAEKPSGIVFDKLLKRIIKACNDTEKYLPSKRMVDFDDVKLEKSLNKLVSAGKIYFSNGEKEKRVVILAS